VSAEREVEQLADEVAAARFGESGRVRRLPKTTCPFVKCGAMRFTRIRLLPLG